VLVRSWQEISDNNIFLVAGGVTYAVLVALFPALAALVSLYGLVLDPAQVEKQVAALTGVVPQQTQDLISAQLHQLVTASSGALGFGAIFGLVVALWAASRGMSGLINALNIAYEQKETRGFVQLNRLALTLTLGMIVGGLVVIALVGVLPAVIGAIGLGSVAQWLLLILEWPLLLLCVMTALAVLYRYAPDRRVAKWRWITPGAVVATVLWLLASIAFSAYVANFNSYNKTYGSLGAVVVLLTWLYWSAFIVLVGAVINTQTERQTRRDSTVEPPKPMGQRGATAADTLGRDTG
jgi:membrane protein